MYVPTAFAETDPVKLQEFIRQHGFATLVSQDGDEPLASHLPLLLNRGAGPLGTLIGHMSNANPQWKQADGRRVLAIFHGPHAPISPSWYRVDNAVPTWNYVVVHAYGVFRVETDPKRLRDGVRQLVAAYETDSPSPWSMDQPDPDFLEGLLDGIVGFEIAINRFEGKWKLSQNHDPVRRQRVIDALRSKGGSNERHIAALMSQMLREVRAHGVKNKGGPADLRPGGEGT